jgi:4-hydroxy-tetrahydrodipicolinate reductase
MSKYPAAVPLRVCVAGVTGWTGSAVAAAVEAADDLELVAGVSRLDPASYSTIEEALDAVPADVLVDYTNAAAVKGHVLAALDRRVAVVVGSSGLSASDYEEIDERARQLQVGVIAAGNFSLTAALMLRFATEAARHLASWEVID